MERLTEYNQKLKEYFYPYCFQEDTCAGLGCEIPDCRFSEKACKKLGQYEDTGLMPEEVQELKEELEKYRAVGTVEEFRALKENERNCKDCAGCTQWKCDCSNIRAKAIDDFAEKLKAEYDNNMRIPEIEVVFAKAIVEQVKGQLKGGAEE